MVSQKTKPCARMRCVQDLEGGDWQPVNALLLGISGAWFRAGSPHQRRRQLEPQVHVLVHTNRTLCFFCRHKMSQTYRVIYVHISQIPLGWQLTCCFSASSAFHRRAARLRLWDGCRFSCVTRQQLRRRFRLPATFGLPDGCGDCAVHTCCMYCASHQELRELAVRGVGGPGAR